MSICKECKSCIWYKPGAAEGCWGEAKPCRLLKERGKTKAQETLKEWKVWGKDLLPIKIKAPDMDAALAKARRIDPNYCAAQRTD